LPERLATDDEGRFVIDGLVPGLTYIISPSERADPQIRVVVQPGETKDLGDLTAKE
jgi:hypothetical protein